MKTYFEKFGDCFVEAIDVFATINNIERKHNFVLEINSKDLWNIIRAKKRFKMEELIEQLKRSGMDANYERVVRYFVSVWVKEKKIKCENGEYEVE